MKVSLAEHIRRLVARDLGPQRQGASPERLFDLDTSAGSDVARHKDDYLAEATESEATRKRGAGPSA